MELIYCHARILNQNDLNLYMTLERLIIVTALIIQVLFGQNSTQLNVNGIAYYKSGVLLENADPGFDWIFTKNPAGLITKYGGVASHMSIRCAEIGLPAAIGCGESLFNRFSRKYNVNRNDNRCSNQLS